MQKIEGLDCILLIDDDEATNFIHKVVIKDSNVDVHVESCTSAEQGLDYLRCAGEYSGRPKYPQPGIIFLDINMPGMNGWEFLDHYKQLPEEQKATVVIAMLTTSLNPDDRKKGEEIADIRSFRSKPLTTVMIHEIIDENFQPVQ